MICLICEWQRRWEAAGFRGAALLEMKPPPVANGFDPYGLAQSA